MLHITISSSGVISWPGHQCRCALGQGGLVAEASKREGDGATPMGTYCLRRVLYRADRLSAPETQLPLRAMRQDDGWCDDPMDAAYNRPVRLPYPASAEALWRTDHVYDLIGILSHNDAPPVPGLGSAIFMHLARPDFSPTRGCVALAEPDLRALLAWASPATRLVVG